jgi:hypothetical protein
MDVVSMETQTGKDFVLNVTKTSTRRLNRHNRIMILYRKRYIYALLLRKLSI